MTSVPVALPPDLVRAWWTDLDPVAVVSRDEGGALRIPARFVKRAPFGRAASCWPQLGPRCAAAST